MCSACVPVDQIISIQKLQLDLGTCSFEKLHKHIVGQVRRRLPSVLMRQMQNRQKSHATTLQDLQYEAVLHHLQHGCAHWKHTWSTVYTPETAYRSILTQHPERLSEMWETLRRCPQAAWRCVAEFSCDTVRKTIALLAGPYTEAVVSMASRLTALQAQMQPSCRGRASFTQSVWEALLRQLQTAKTYSFFDPQHFTEGVLNHLSALTRVSLFQIANALTTHLRRSISWSIFSKDALVQSVYNLHETILDPSSPHQVARYIKDMLLHAHAESELHTFLQTTLQQLPAPAARAALSVSLKETSLLQRLTRSDVCFYTVVQHLSSTLWKTSHSLEKLCHAVTLSGRAYDKVWDLIKRFALRYAMALSTDCRMPVFSAALAKHVHDHAASFFYKLLSLSATRIDQCSPENTVFDKRVLKHLHQALHAQASNALPTLSNSNTLGTTSRATPLKDAHPQTRPTTSTPTPSQLPDASLSTWPNSDTPRHPAAKEALVQDTHSQTRPTTPTPTSLQRSRALHTSPNTVHLISVLEEGLRLGWFSDKQLRRWSRALLKTAHKQDCGNASKQRQMLYRAAQSLWHGRSTASKRNRRLNNAFQVWERALEQAASLEEIRQTMTALAHHIQQQCALYVPAARSSNDPNAVDARSKETNTTSHKHRRTNTEDLTTEPAFILKQHLQAVPHGPALGLETAARTSWEAVLERVSVVSSLSIKTISEGVNTVQKAYRTHVDSLISKVSLDAMVERDLWQVVVLDQRTDMTAFELVYRMISSWSVRSERDSASVYIASRTGVFQKLAEEGFAWTVWLPWCWAAHHVCGWKMTAIAEALQVGIRSDNPVAMTPDQWMFRFQNTFAPLALSGLSPPGNTWLQGTCWHWYRTQHRDCMRLWHRFLRLQSFPAHFRTAADFLHRMRCWLSPRVAAPPLEEALRDANRRRALVERLEDAALRQLLNFFDDRHRDVVSACVQGWLALWPYIRALGYAGHTRFRKTVWHQTFRSLATGALVSLTPTQLDNMMGALAPALQMPPATLLQRLSAYVLTNPSWSQRFSMLAEPIKKALTAHHKRTLTEAKHRWPTQRFLQDLFRLLRDGAGCFVKEMQEDPILLLERGLYDRLTDRDKYVLQAFGKSSEHQLTCRRFVRCFSPRLVEAWIHFLAGAQKDFVRQYLHWAYSVDLTHCLERHDATLWQMQHRESVLYYLLQCGQKVFSTSHFIQSCLQHVQSCTGVSPQSMLAHTAVKSSLQEDLEVAVGTMSTFVKAPLQPNPLRQGLENGEYATEKPDNSRLQVHIENGGLIFIWPFIEKLFTRQGLLEKGEFVDALALQNALHTLQHAVTRRLYTAGWQLVLNKLLCGMPYSAAAAPGYRPRRPEATHVCQDADAKTPPQSLEVHRLSLHTQAVLEEVVQAWPSLKELEKIDQYKDGFTWVDFQEYFLNRTALLQRITDTSQPYWHLTLPSLVHDSERILPPWPIDVIELPWMDQALSVHWMAQ